MFGLFKKKEKVLSPIEIERQYQEALKRVRKIDATSCRSFVRDIKEYAQKECRPQAGDDLLEKKAEFIRLYSFRARYCSAYHIVAHKAGTLNSSPLWCQKWHDYEQQAHLCAQKKWREMVSHTR